MSELAAWYVPTDSLPWVLRSPAGRVWAMPNVPNAWGKGLRELRDQPPSSDPLPPIHARAIAILLGLVAFGPLSDEDVMMYAWEAAEERAALEPRAEVAPVVDSLRTHRAHVTCPADVLRIAGLSEVQS